MSRYLAGADPTKVISAKADVLPKFPQVDVGTTATLAFPTPNGTGPADGLTATLNAHFRLPMRFGFLPQWPKIFVRVTGTRGTVELYNFAGPWLYHYITVKSSEQEGGPLRKRTEKQYGNHGWTTQVSFFFFSFISSRSSHILMLSLSCVDIAISWRHSSTNCAGAILNTGMTRRTRSPTCNGSKLSTKRFVSSYSFSH